MFRERYFHFCPFLSNLGQKQIILKPAVCFITKLNVGLLIFHFNRTICSKMSHFFILGPKAKLYQQERVTMAQAHYLADFGKKDFLYNSL